MRFMWYWRWRYKRIAESFVEGTPLCELLNKYNDLSHRLSLDKTTYRQRIRYNLYMKHTNIAEAISHLSKINLAMSNKIIGYSDNTYTMIPREWIKLNRVLVDREGYPVNDANAWLQLRTEIDSFCKILNTYKDEDDYLYHHYSRLFISVIKDCIELLDAIISLILGVDDERRHPPLIVSGRPRHEYGKKRSG